MKVHVAKLGDDQIEAVGFVELGDFGFKAKVFENLASPARKTLDAPCRKTSRREKLAQKDPECGRLARFISERPGEAVRAPRIGTRGSILARWQAEFVRKQILQATGIDAEIVIIKTTGDKLQQASFAEIGGQGVFIKELEDALLREEIDLAVHSVKDVPTDVPSRLCFPVICRRNDVRDCLVTAKPGGHPLAVDGRLGGSNGGIKRSDERRDDGGRGVRVSGRVAG